MIKYLLVAFLILSSITQFAQTSTIQDGADSKLLTITKNNKGKNNEVLSILEKIEQKKTLNISIKEYHSIIRTTTKVTASISISNYLLKGEYIYKAFDIKNFANPSLISYTYVWQDTQGKTLKTDQAENVKFKSGAPIIKLTADYSNKSDNSKIYLSELDFHYSTSDFKRLSKITKKIDAYYDADARLNMMNQELDKIKTDTLELLYEYKQATINNSNTLSTIRSERFSSNLHLDKNDPINLKSQFGQTDEKNKRIQKQINYTLKNMHEAYYLKGKDWLKWNNNKKAKSYFIKSITKKGNYAPPHYEIANLLFQNKKYTETLDSCEHILKLMAPDTDTRYNTVQLAEKIIYIKINAINNLIKNDEYSKAYTKLNNCIADSKRIVGIKKFEEFDKLSQTIFNKSYNDLAYQAKTKIENENLDAGEIAIDSLVNFRIQHEKYFVNTQKEDVLFNLLYEAWITRGENYLNKNQTDSSIYALTKAQKICTENKMVSCSNKLYQLSNLAHKTHYEQMLILADKAISDSLANEALTILNNAEIYREQNKLSKNIKADTLYIKAQQIKYTDLINEGDRGLNEHKMRESLAFYQEAYDIEQTVKIIKNPTLSSKIIDAAKQYTLLICTQGETLSESLLLNKAYSKLNNAENLATNYKLNTDNDVKLALDSLSKKLKQGKCKEAYYKYKIQIEAAVIFIKQKDFINANNALNKAKQLNKINKDCVIEDSLANQLKNEIHSILHYQKTLIYIDEEIEKGNYINAIDQYNTLTKFYKDSCTNNFGISHQDLYTFITTNKNPRIIDNAVPYYINQGEPENALKMLNTLYRRNYISSWSKESQIKIGAVLAKTDFKKNPNTNPKKNVIEYTKDLKWFNHLKKAYITEWKNNLINNSTLIK